MDNQTRIERLTELQGMLTHHSQLFGAKPLRFKRGLRFDMDLWYCGTAACALGSACLHKPFREQGLGLSGNTPDFEGHNGFDAGVEFFGITIGESSRLFSPANYSCADISPLMVAARVEELINKYKEK